MLIPAIVVALSGILALIWHPSHQARSLIQHFAAGVVIAVLAVEVLPELTREHAPNWVLIASFAFGVLFMYLMKILSEHLEAQSAASGSEGANIGLISTVFIDAAVDELPPLDMLLVDVRNLQREKWDWALPDELLRKAYASLYLNLEEALSWARALPGDHAFPSRESPLSRVDEGGAASAA